MRALSLSESKYRFPWRENNQFELLVDGDRFFPRMLKAIEAAHHYVLLEMYLFESGSVADRFIDALQTAAQRGVAVYLLLDDFGALRLQRHDRERLAHINIQTVYYNPLRYRNWYRNLQRNHRKLLAVDGEVAFVGGAGITDQFDPPYHPERRWRDTFVEIKGPVVADWQQLFKETWDRCGPHRLALAMRSPLPISNDQRGRVAVSSGPTRQENKRALVKRVRRAAHRAWFATAYFIPSWKIRRALRRAARHGIDVRLLLPGAHTDHPAARHAGRRFYGRLLRDGVRIFEYRSRFLHAKTALCDDWVSIGSSNLDRWNLRWNLDADQLVDSGRFAEEVRSMLEQDFEQSREYTYDEWRRRPWHRRLLEWFWGRIDLLIEHIGSRHRFRH